MQDCSADFPDDILELIGGENAPFRSPPAYGNALITVVIPELFQEAQANLFYAQLKHRGVDLA
ncbi:MAG: hypothetical protein NNA20_12985 [Nitrospira sp.]|nr:hypothetical protein [Nitrospira sp.]MCP9443487.1 hypothetical protein [Nitrospira sp.]